MDQNNNNLNNQFNQPNQEENNKNEYIQSEDAKEKATPDNTEQIQTGVENVKAEEKGNETVQDPQSLPPAPSPFAQQAQQAQFQTPKQPPQYQAPQQQYSPQPQRPPQQPQQPPYSQRANQQQFGYGQQPGPTPNYYQQQPQEKNDSMAIASLVLGGVSLLFFLLSIIVFYWFPWPGIISIIAGIVGLILAIISKKKSTKKSGLATGGLITSAIGVGLSIIMTIACVACICTAANEVSRGLGDLYDHYDYNLEDLFD